MPVSSWPFPRGNNLCLSLLVLLVFVLSVAVGVQRYYATYTSFGSGDTIINTLRANGGPATRLRRWQVECLDGEAVIGIRDMADDFQKLTDVWCKFTFPYKQWTNGLYPYYPDCFVKNYTFQFHCYSPKYHEASVDAFITGFWDNDFQFMTFRPYADDPQPYKCCKVPPGYYIDYPSCYYQPTRDQYGEYYDATNAIIVYCATGYVVTGIAKKISPFSFDYHIEWIQCCRVGYGAVPNIHPPHSSAYTYSSYANVTTGHPYRPPASYAHQYEVGNLGTQNLVPAYSQGLHYKSPVDVDAERYAVASGRSFNYKSHYEEEDAFLYH